MYAVFGQSKVKARTKAEKEVEVCDKGRALTLEEYTQRLKQRTDELYKAAKIQRVSDIYPDKSIAQEYLEGVEKAGTGRNFVIRKRICTMDENGEPGSQHNPAGAAQDPVPIPATEFSHQQ